MAYQFRATCRCGYRSRRLMLGETCVCPLCRDLVGVPNVPFRYALAPCPDCGSPLFEDDALTDILGKGWLREDRPSDLTCPKCENAKLQFRLGAHCYLKHEVHLPDVGDLVDGRLYHQGVIDIPWFTLAEANVSHDVPRDVRPGERITLQVAQIAVGEPAGAVARMFARLVVKELELRFVGKLPPNRRRPRPETS